MMMTMAARLTLGVTEIVLIEVDSSNLTRTVYWTETDLFFILCVLNISAFKYSLIIN